MKLLIIILLNGFAFCHNQVSGNSSDKLIGAGKEKFQIRSSNWPLQPPPGYPKSEYPQSEYPQPGSPQSGYSQSKYPQPGYVYIPFLFGYPPLLFGYPPSQSGHPNGPFQPPSSDEDQNQLEDLKDLVKMQCESGEEMSENVINVFEKIASFLKIKCNLKSKPPEERCSKDGAIEAANKFESTRFQQFKNMLLKSNGAIDGTETYHPYVMYKDFVLYPLYDAYVHERRAIKNDNRLSQTEKYTKDRQLDENFNKAYKEVLIMYNCSLHQEVKSIISQTSKLLEYNNKRQKIIDGIKQVEQQMDRVTYYQDDDSIIKLGKEIGDKLDVIQQTAANINFGKNIDQFKQHIQAYFYQHYVYEANKNGDFLNPYLYASMKNKD